MEKKKKKINKTVKVFWKTFKNKPKIIKIWCIKEFIEFQILLVPWKDPIYNRHLIKMTKQIHMIPIKTLRSENLKNQNSTVRLFKSEMKILSIQKVLIITNKY